MKKGNSSLIPLSSHQSQTNVWRGVHLYQKVSVEQSEEAERRDEEEVALQMTFLLNDQKDFEFSAEDTI